MRRQPIAIIGAGVIGITTGIRLLEAGYAVTVFAREDKNNMASYAAGAFWCPYLACPEALVFEWAKRSYEVFQSFTVEDGVELLEFLEYYRDPVEPPLWTKILSHQALTGAELLEQYKTGYKGKVYRIDSGVYMQFLLDQYQKLGGKINFGEVNDLTDINKSFPIIVNCSGVWSNQLVPDSETYPIRGQFMVVDKIPGVNTIKFGSVDNDYYTLIVPRMHDCYIGGTTNAHSWDRSVHQNISEGILRRAQILEPLLKNIQVLSQGVGFRPGRSHIRLEREQLPDGRTVIHNYGHGGSGYTISWGCAESVVNLVEATVTDAI